MNGLVTQPPGGEPACRQAGDGMSGSFLGIHQ